MIEVKNLSFQYSNNNQVLFDLSLSFKENQIVFIVGQNGCGKTTFLNLLINNLKSTKNTIYVESRDINSLSYKELSHYIAYVPQIINTSIDFSVIDYLLLGLSNTFPTFSHPKKSDYIKVLEISKKYNIEKYLFKKFTELSGGEKQLITIIRALIQDSKYIIMDEPTSALDYANQQKILKIIEQLREERKTVIVTSHNPNHCFNIECDVVLMKNGKVFQYGKNVDVMTSENLSYLYDFEVNVINTEKGQVCISNR